MIQVFPKFRIAGLIQAFFFIVFIMVLLAMGKKFHAMIVMARLSPQEAKAVAEIRRLGGRFNAYALDPTSSRKSVIRVLLGGAQLTDKWLEHLKLLANLAVLDLSDTQVTDAGLEHLRGLVLLEDLDISGTQVTDAGLEYLKEMAKLRSLGLWQTRITDAGLKQIKGLKALESLYLRRTQVTDIGLEHLKELTQLRSLSLQSTQVTDAGLEHIKVLTNLDHLDLIGTQVTDAGLEHLKGLNKLTTLYLDHTKVTDEGVKELQQLLPNCKIEHLRALPWVEKRGGLNERDRSYINNLGKLTTNTGRHGRRQTHLHSGPRRTHPSRRLGHARRAPLPLRRPRQHSGTA